MIRSIVISETAQNQIKQAANWFLDQHSGLEIKFVLDLNDSMEYIQRHPNNCQIRYSTIRIKFLTNFEFGIHYIFDERTVFVLAVFHTKQDSDNWFQ